VLDLHGNSLTAAIASHGDPRSGCRHEEHLMNAAEAPWLPLVERAHSLDPDPDLAHLSDADLERDVRDNAARIAALTCQWLAQVTEFVIRGLWADQGARTPGQWLSWACSMAPGTAREHIRVGLALRELPLIRERFAAGTLSYSKVRAITRVATPESQELLLHLADSAPAADLERIITGTRRQLGLPDPVTGTDHDPDGQEGQEPADPRSFHRIEVDADLVEFRIRMPAADAAAFEQRIDRLVDLADRQSRGDDPADPADDQPHADVLPLHAPDQEDSRQEGHQDTAGHASPGTQGPVRPARPARHVRRVAALCGAVADTVARGGPDRSGEDDHLVVLQVTTTELAAAVGMTNKAADNADGQVDHRDNPTGDHNVPAGTRQPRRVTIATGRRRTMTIPAQVLARLTCTADLRLAASHHDGHPADIGRRSRRVPADLRRALLLRDRTCRFPGCDQRRHLHAHHVIHWAAGGPTNLDNLLMLCPYHHRFVHDHDWTLQPVDPAAGHYRFLPPGSTQAHPHTGTLRGVPAETPPAHDLPPMLDEPHPTALQPPWWDGHPYNLSWTIDALAHEILDPAIASTIAYYQPHPAMAA
jgi:hypothetical protein